MQSTSIASTARCHHRFTVFDQTAMTSPPTSRHHDGQLVAALCRSGISVELTTQSNSRDRFPLATDELTELFKRLDVDGNGTIDFDEFKAGAKKEPLLVNAFLAPVHQGSLATAPAAVRKTKPGAGSGPVAAAREASRTSETPTKGQGEGRTTSADVSASPNDSGSCSPGTASAAAAVAPEKLGSWSEVPAPKDGGMGCDDDVGGRDKLSTKRSRVEGDEEEKR